MSTEIEVTWQPADMVEVTLGQPDDFLKVRETLTRIGVASGKSGSYISHATSFTSKASITSFTSKSCSLSMVRAQISH